MKPKKNAGFSSSESRCENIISITRITTPLGPMLAGATEKGICLLEFGTRRILLTEMQTMGKKMNAVFLPGKSKYFSRLEKQLNEYFSGKRTNFSVPMDISGTDFQKKAWDALLKIPYGETISYKKQALLMGHGGAARAVGTANGENRISILIPCHRVIAADGTLAGYGGGLPRKKYLIDLEKQFS